MTGYVAIGRGIGAAIVGEHPMLVAGPLFAQIERERRDGPRYVEALTGARAMRQQTANRWSRRDRRFHFMAWMSRAWTCERQRGAPEGWFTR